MLLKDGDGTVVQGIADEMRCTPERIMTKIYEKWLEKKSKNASWEDLIQRLKDCGLNTIAQDIKDGLGDNSGIPDSVLFLWNLNLAYFAVPMYYKCKTLLRM